MPSATTSLVSLRRALSERFPKAHSSRQLLAASPTVATGISTLDQLLGGGWPKGKLSELIGVGSGSGSAQVIHALLHHIAATGQFLALVDGMDSFDVDAVEADALARLLWVRCTKADEALKATDILLRDRNFPFVVVDLKLNPVAQLRRIQSNIWHRFRRLQEQNGTTLLVVTPTQLAGGANCRVRVESKLGLEAMTRPPTEAVAQLQFELLRTEEGIFHEDSAQTG